MAHLAKTLRLSHTPSSVAWDSPRLNVRRESEVERTGLPASSLRSAEHATAHGNLFEPTIWYSIDRNGRITVNIIRAEIGPHIGTALARIVADELEADWDKVAIIQVDTDPKWGEMITGGSWSVWQSFPYSQPSRRRGPHRSDRSGRETSRR